MFPGLNPKKMQAMMKQLGMDQEEINASRVIIEGPDKNIIIENPSVVRIKMQGSENFQISGDVKEVEGELPETTADVESEDLSAKFDEDVKTIMEKVGCIEEEARNALEKNDGDLTEAILELS